MRHFSTIWLVSVDFHQNFFYNRCTLDDDDDDDDDDAEWICRARHE